MAKPLPTITYRGSVWQALKLVGLGVVMMAASLFAAWVGWQRSNAFELSAGVVGTLFFGFCLVIACGRAFEAGRVEITLTARGLRDPRVAREEIPWSAIVHVKTWSHLGQDIMVLQVKPEIEAALEWTSMARWSRRANTALGADGLCITAQGLDVPYAKLLQTTLEYLNAAASNSTSQA